MLCWPNTNAWFGSRTSIYVAVVYMGCLISLQHMTLLAVSKSTWLWSNEMSEKYARSLETLLINTGALRGGISRVPFNFDGHRGVPAIGFIQLHHRLGCWSRIRRRHLSERRSHKPAAALDLVTQCRGCWPGNKIENSSLLRKTHHTSATSVVKLRNRWSLSSQASKSERRLGFESRAPR